MLRIEEKGREREKEREKEGERKREKERERGRERKRERERVEFNHLYTRVRRNHFVFESVIQSLEIDRGTEGLIVT